MIRGVYPNHFHDIITLSHRKSNENYQIHKQSGNYFMFCMYLCTKQLITFLYLDLGKVGLLQHEQIYNNHYIAANQHNKFESIQEPRIIIFLFWFIYFFFLFHTLFSFFTIEFIPCF